jgi:hypothetical protein
MTLFYTILFSLGDAKANQYVNCLQLQRAALVRTGMLKHTDRYYVLADAASAKVLSETPGLDRVRVIVVPTPSSLKGGMMMKYLFPFVCELRDESVVYLDLDVFPVRPALFNLEPETFYAYPEGGVSDKNYSGGRSLDLPAGCSGGFFAYRTGPRIEALFKTILTEIADEQEEFYTLDQPTYNHVLSRHKDIVKFLPHEMVSFNGNTNADRAIFWNMCGDPGDGPFHFRKMLGVYLSLFS